MSILIRFNLLQLQSGNMADVLRNKIFYGVSANKTIRYVEKRTYLVIHLRQLAEHEQLQKV